ncbi:hypothetical protein PanWU01x14_258600 [Parasponia andersonii]|uniref:Uncharacterized protein n=1 Tax=Parasponia andersonii TaxID=3476 RepID=A0A2P5B9N3_PARAD|nr:hypothetical protein PanWU01x14_258600 [Parasponia andersonii]
MYAFGGKEANNKFILATKNLEARILGNSMSKWYILVLRVLYGSGSLPFATCLVKKPSDSKGHWTFQWQLKV